MSRNKSSVAQGTTRRQLMFSAAAVAGVALMPASAVGAGDDGISHSAEAIHQEPVFKARPQQVYDALTNAKQFDQVQHLSAAMRAKEVADKPARIGSGAGAAFSLFGGNVSGRHIELVPGKRIVQAWRAQSWKEGEYSIVRFELVEQDGGTKIVFDHLGFPQGTAEHLATGWKAVIGNRWRSFCRKDNAG